MFIALPRQSCMSNPPCTAENKIGLTGPRMEKKRLPIADRAPLQYEWAMVPHEIANISELEGFGGLKADLRRSLCAGDLQKRYWVYRGWLKAMERIPSQLLMDRMCLDKPRDALYVESAFRYLFKVSDYLSALAGEGEYLMASDDDSSEVRRILRAAWPLSKRMGVIFTAMDYVALVTGRDGEWLAETKCRSSTIGLSWPRELEKEEFPLLGG